MEAVLPPAPRRVRVRRARRLDWLCWQAAILLPLLGLAALAVPPARRTWLLLRGQDHPGVVTAYRPSLAARPVDPPPLSFAYQVEGRRYELVQELPRALRREGLPPGTPLALRVLPAHPDWGALVCAGPGWAIQARDRVVLGWLGFALNSVLVGAVCGTLAWRLHAQRACVARGLWTTGRVVALTRLTRSANHRVVYRFEAVGVAGVGPVAWERSMTVGPDLVDAVHVGREEPVLYLPDWPQASVVYGLSLFEVADEELTV